MLWLYYLHLIHLRYHDNQYRITALVQICNQPAPLKTQYLAELLDLSVDKPAHLYRFDLKKAKERLLASPWIKNAEIKKIHPQTLEIDYEMRQPVACLGDYRNAAFDSEGKVIPLEPHFNSKGLPIVYFGEKVREGLWGHNLAQEKVKLAMNILEKVRALNERVKFIDVSEAFSESYGQRQVVVALESEPGKRVTLRLNGIDYESGLKRYKKLRQYYQEKGQLYPWIVDLRMEHLGFFYIER